MALLVAVTPYVGVWIETDCSSGVTTMREVTPYVGVWIETEIVILIKNRVDSHSLCGSVD